MYNSYLGTADSLKTFYKDSLEAYFVENLRNKQWENVTVVLSENPVICLQLVLMKGMKKLRS
jgi:hypothetical protein